MFQVGSQCYSTKTQALSASASAESGRVLTHGGDAHVVTVSAVSENSVTYSLQPLAGGIPTVLEVPQAPQVCQLLTMTDVAPIGAAIMTGWLVIFGIMSMLKARTDDD